MRQTIWMPPRESEKYTSPTFSPTISATDKGKVCVLRELAVLRRLLPYRLSRPGKIRMEGSVIGSTRLL